MALEATHIRFALDLKDKFKVQDLNKYLSGTIYPDSRFYTKIERHLTHNLDFTKEKFYQDDDFKKGWAVHIICDYAQGEIFDKLFPELFVGLESEVHHGNKIWIVRTSLKILQDIIDANQIKIKNYIKYLDYINNPNNEDLAKIREYYQMLIRHFDTKNFGIEDEFKISAMFGSDDKFQDKIKSKTHELAQNPIVMQKVKMIYQMSMDMYNVSYNETEMH